MGEQFATAHSVCCRDIIDGFAKCLGMVNYTLKPYRCLQHHELCEDNPLVFVFLQGKNFSVQLLFFFSKVRNGFALNLCTLVSASCKEAYATLKKQNKLTQQVTGVRFPAELSLKPIFCFFPLVHCSYCLLFQFLVIHLTKQKNCFSFTL